MPALTAYKNFSPGRLRPLPVQPSLGTSLNQMASVQPALMKIQHYLIYCLYIVCLALALLAGCNTPEPPLPAPTQAKFDPEDSDATFRWLMQVASPLVAEKEASRSRRYANPLSADFDAEENALDARWKTQTEKLIGKGVTWPAIVREVTTGGVYVDGWESGWDRGQEGIHQYLSFENGPTNRPRYGGYLTLGKCVDLETAREILPKQWVYVSGTVSKIDASLDKNGYISVDIKDCKMLLPSSE